MILETAGPPSNLEIPPQSRLKENILVFSSTRELYIFPLHLSTSTHHKVRSVRIEHIPSGAPTGPAPPMRVCHCGN